MSQCSKVTSFSLLIRCPHKDLLPLPVKGGQDVWNRSARWGPTDGCGQKISLVVTDQFTQTVKLPRSLSEYEMRWLSLVCRSFVRCVSGRTLWHLTAKIWMHFAFLLERFIFTAWHKQACFFSCDSDTLWGGRLVIQAVRVFVFFTDI